MNEIRSLLKVASRRLEASSWLSQFHLAAVVIAVLALALMIADRLFESAFVPWIWVVPTMVALAGLISIPLWMRHRRTEMQLAIVVDERLDLREKLSTAIHCQGRTDAFARAAFEDAVIAARDERNHERSRRAFQVTAPGGWWMSPVFVLAALMISMISPLDLFATEEEVTNERDIKQVENVVEISVGKVIEQLQDNDEFDDLVDGLTAPEADAGQAATPEDIRRNAIKKLTDMQKKLEDILRGTEGQTAEALQNALKQLKMNENGAASELGKALQQGDFTKALKALEDMKKATEGGSLSPEEKEQAAKQLEDMAKQLQNLAQQQQQLAQALEQAGLDPALAQNMQALQQALQQNQNLNQQQKQALKQMAQAQQAANQMCQKMGQACQNMAQNMQNGNKMGQGAGKMAKQLNQMEQMQMMLQQAQAAANACQGQCQGMGQNLGLQQGQGGMGNRGQGSGGKAPIAPAPWRTRIVKANVHTDPNGEIIARMLIEGMPQNAGESKVTAKQVELRVTEGLAEAQDQEDVPLKYREANLHYFGELQEITTMREAAPAEAEASDDD